MILYFFSQFFYLCQQKVYISCVGCWVWVNHSEEVGFIRQWLISHHRTPLLHHHSLDLGSHLVNTICKLNQAEITWHPLMFLHFQMSIDSIPMVGKVGLFQLEYILLSDLNWLHWMSKIRNTRINNNIYIYIYIIYNNIIIDKQGFRYTCFVATGMFWQLSINILKRKNIQEEQITREQPAPLLKLSENWSLATGSANLKRIHDKLYKLSCLQVNVNADVISEGQGINISLYYRL